jgi:hypothetical protein
VCPSKFYQAHWLECTLARNNTKDCAPKVSKDFNRALLVINFELILRLLVLFASISLQAIITDCFVCHCFIACYRRNPSFCGYEEERGPIPAKISPTKLFKRIASHKFDFSLPACLSLVEFAGHMFVSRLLFGDRLLPTFRQCAVAEGTPCAAHGSPEGGEAG